MQKAQGTTPSYDSSSDSKQQNWSKKMPVMEMKKPVALKSSYEVVGFEGNSLEMLAKNISKGLENLDGWIREIRPVAWTEKSESLGLGGNQYEYTTRFGALILYEPEFKEVKYEPPKCEFCGESEDNRRGTYLFSKFYCNECLQKKLEV